MHLGAKAEHIDTPCTIIAILIQHWTLCNGLFLDMVSSRSAKHLTRQTTCFQAITHCHRKLAVHRMKAISSLLWRRDTFRPFAGFVVHDVRTRKSIAAASHSRIRSSPQQCWQHRLICYMRLSLWQRHAAEVLAHISREQAAWQLRSPAQPFSLRLSLQK